MRDAYQRPLRDLRISVTDRCNFRCTCCMPRTDRYSALRGQFDAQRQKIEMSYIGG